MRLTLFRGIPFGGKYSGRTEGLTDAGWYGSGEYWTTQRRVARHYAHGDDGAVFACDFVITNPLYLTYDEADKYKKRYKTADKKLDSWERHDNARALTRHWIKKGYDAIIIDDGSQVLFPKP